MSLAADLAGSERAESQTRPLAVYDLGLIPYPECWDLQQWTSRAVSAGAQPDTLLLLEHPHTYTCGRSGGRDHILMSEADLARLGATVLDVDRGGDVTYHGPGQLVAYSIIKLDLRPIGRDYGGYLRALEAALIGTLADFAITGERVEGYSGVWVRTGERADKVAAIGVKVDGRGVTSHGIALNVATDLGFFDKIVPCGIADADKGVTSMQKLVGVPVAMDDVKTSFARNFARVFAFHDLTYVRSDARIGRISGGC